MSGVSLAVAPRTEPEETTAAGAQSDQNILNRKPQQPPGTAAVGIMGSLRVIELQLVAFIMVFSASGLVPLLDMVFPAFTSAYLLLLSRFAFPAHGGASASSQEIYRGSRMFRFYVIVGTTVGLFLPLAYVLGGFARGDDHAVRSATPHLFLLSFQILTENIISGLSLFSPPVRAFVPLFYTIRRIFVIIDWMNEVWFHRKLPADAQFQDVAWNWFGRMLAVANLMYFSVNLLCFLIPRFLPRSFERYFKERDAKVAGDKPSAGADPTDKKTD